MTRVKARPEKLTHGQLLELMLGPRSAEGLQAFEGDTHAEDVYWAHRDELFDLLGGDITASWAFKKFEARRLKG